MHFSYVHCALQFMLWNMPLGRVHIFNGFVLRSKSLAMQISIHSCKLTTQAFPGSFSYAAWKVSQR